jgi:hypothetical protein
LRAPAQQHVGQRPWSSGAKVQSTGHVGGVRLKLHRPAGFGLLLAQVVLRGFGEMPKEVASSGRVEIMSPTQEITALLEPPLNLSGAFLYITVEPWLVWEGNAPLVLAQQPEIF